jgi:16S rRNA (adenine1518-N6/adenine1519-N6)-dimethyltransferase
LHVVELDRSLEEGLRGVLPEHAQLHMGDALDLDLTTLDPVPTKIVANLPYGIAATVILRTIEQLETVALWLVMVQREVGERLAAAPGTSAYGAPSVLAQVACDVKVVRAVSRTVFRPVPRVDSVLVRLRRRDRGAGPALRKLINDSFAHRRKTLPGSLALAPGWPDDIRARAVQALEAIGLPPDTRAERLAPGDFSRLIAELNHA